MQRDNAQEKLFLTFEEMVQEYKKRPKTKFLWNGIKDKSFGLVFGPAKSGKTILCESLAMKIATGAKEFLEYNLDGVPKKVLFVGLEEHWDNRVELNLEQVNHLNDTERELINKNFRYQPISFTKKIVQDSDWKKLIKTIIASEAEVVFIDSITRINHGKLEDSKTAEEIMQRLRGVCYDLGVTLICIHHTPKMHDRPLTMNCIKGSSTFAQESDFAIGFNRTSRNHRYMKNVFFRYAGDDDDTVKEVEIDDFGFSNYIKESDEDEILSRSDRRRSNNKLDKVVNFFLENSDATYTTQQAIGHFTKTLSIKGRMVETYLKKAADQNLIDGSVHGYYKAIKTTGNVKR